MKNFYKLSLFTLLLAPFFNSAQESESPPKVVTPSENNGPPSDAVILFNGTSLDQFQKLDGGAVDWNVNDNVLTVGKGSIQTVKQFGDIQLHIEWRTPPEAAHLEGQKSGNSGIYLMGKYEVQVLNSYENETYFDGQAGAIYGQHPPLVNASKKPGEWQVYDIIFRAPMYKENGGILKPAEVTVLHNGILIQDHSVILGPTQAYNKDLPEKAEKGPMMLQDHSNPVSYRNIWIREL